MFREVARTARRLEKEEAIDLLRKELRGVLSVLGDDGYPYGMPLNHYYCEEDGKLYFHSGKTGHKIDAIMRSDKASFCVLDGGERKEGEWALTFRSAIVFGRTEIVTDEDKVVAIARKLSRKFTDDEDYISREIEEHGRRTLMFALVPEHITGKWVREA
ncbi:MAG: pyridoxamine 5'-phosphate oxidase family protein [Oscillospiraceae bacterium]|nr:pyridoxamine 5'-phosphate oxidase family protein [Oscillospiraceae bacterium]